MKLEFHIYTKEINSKQRLCVFKQKHKVIAQMTLIIKPEKVEIWAFGVVKEYRNKHLGTEFLKQIISMYPTKPFWLGVNKGNDIAKHMYENLGFICVEDCGSFFAMERRI